MSIQLRMHARNSRPTGRAYVNVRVAVAARDSGDIVASLPYQIGKHRVGLRVGRAHTA
jgi:hypothetical protein